MTGRSHYLFRHWRGLSMRTAALVAFLSLATVAGCAKSKLPPPPPVPISGKVVYADGKPVANMVIFLHPQDEPAAGERPNGALDKDGRYSLKVIPGRYKITLLPIPSQAGSAGASSLPSPQKSDPKDAWNPMARYRDVQQTTLEFTVTDAGGEMEKLTVK